MQTDISAPLTAEGFQALAVTALAVVLFLSNRLRVDVVALIVMAVLILSGLLTPQEGISGFAHEATLTVAFMLVLATAMLRTGAVELLARWMASAAGGSELRLLVLLLAVVVPLSAFINNTAAVAVLIPMVLSVARATGAAPSRLLMPLSFAGQLGGTLTLVGTSTNLLVAGMVMMLGVERISLFDITLPALVVSGAGLVYLLTIGRWLLPHRTPEADLLRSYELNDYLTVLRVSEGSKLANRTLADTRFGEALGLQVVRIVRGDGAVDVPRGSTILHPDDLLLVEGKIADIAKVEREEGLDVVEDDDTRVLGETAQGHAQFAELLVPRRSGAVRRTVRGLGLRARYGISVMAVRRHAAPLHTPVAEVRLQPGDMLLVQGSADALARVHAESDLVLLGAIDLPQIRRDRLKLAVPIVAGVVLLPALGLMTILVSSLLGVLAMFLTRCITPEEAYNEMDWMVIVLLGAILPLGEAMHRTGAAAFLAHQVISVAAPLGNHGILAGFLLLTTLLTSFISNAAAAAVLAPIAVALAGSLGVSPLPFIFAVMIGASNSFLSPVGYQTNTMVYGPGGYRFSDFLRVGGPLSAIILVVATFVIPMFYPF